MWLWRSVRPLRPMRLLRSLRLQKILMGVKSFSVWSKWKCWFFETIGITEVIEASEFITLNVIFEAFEVICILISVIWWQILSIFFIKTIEQNNKYSICIWKIFCWRLWRPASTFKIHSNCCESNGEALWICQCLFFLSTCWLSGILRPLKKHILRWNTLYIPYIREYCAWRG